MGNHVPSSGTQTTLPMRPALLEAALFPPKMAVGSLHAAAPSPRRTACGDLRFMQASITRSSASLGLVLIAGIAFGLRALGSSDVFGADGSVILAFDDASYHARLVHWGAANFPRWLAFDPLLNHPDGARVPWPPLYDALLSAIAWAAGATPVGIDRMLAWVAPVLGTLAVFPVYFAARALLSRGGALLAAGLFALLPVSILYSRVGNPDHHAWMALLAAAYLSLSLHQDRSVSRAPIRWSACLVVARVFITLSWAGSLLYLAVGEGALLLAALIDRNRGALRMHAMGNAVAAALILPVVMSQPEPLGGWFSASALSGLHVVFFASAAFVSAAWLLLDRMRPSTGALDGTGRAAGLAAFALLLCLSSASVREGLSPAFTYMTASAGFVGNPEQVPLYHWMRTPEQLSSPGSFHFYGGFAYLLPIGLLAAALSVLRRSEPRSAYLVLAVWSAVLCWLAMSQLRWGNDFAPTASVGFAVAAQHGLRATDSRVTAMRFAVMGIVAALVLSPVVVHWPRLAYALRTGEQNAQPSPTVSAFRFAQRIKDVVSNTSHPTSTAARAYDAILVLPGYGHLMHRVAGLATPGDNFGPQFDSDRYDRVLAFFQNTSQSEMVERFDEFEVGWLMTRRPNRRSANLATARLHALDGSARVGVPASEHFRLAAEAGDREPILGGATGPGPPYKLFQWVPGAVIEIEAAPGSTTLAQLELETPAGRRFSWQTTAQADATGRAALRVPYASANKPSSHVQSLGRWRVLADGREVEVEVTESDVLNGARIEVIRIAKSTSQSRPEDASRP